MALDRKLIQALEKKGVTVTKKGNKDAFVPAPKKYPHIHSYDDGCELRNGNTGGTKLVYAGDQLNKDNIKEAKRLDGDIAKAAAVLEDYFG